MDISDIRKIGARLKGEISSHRDELCRGDSLGRGAGGDVTHPIDRRAEEIVLEGLARVNEPVTLVSEECGVRELKGGGPKFLLDPIDGSRNATSGIPLFSTSIALIEGDSINDTSIGYVINLINGDEYWALKGGGSFLNGRAIRTQKDSALRVLAYEAQMPGIDIPKIIHLISLFNRARCFGSTALDMAFLARGAVSVFVVPSPSRSFDFAAGYLLIKEAGGTVTDLDGSDIGRVKAAVDRSTPLLASANEEIHAKAVAVLTGTKL